MNIQDQHLEIARLQQQICKKLGIATTNVIFNFKEKGNLVKFDLVTINPKHEQSFLFHSLTGVDKIDALKKMLEYIEKNYAEESSMTIQWIKIGENILHTSYFRAKNMYEALDKFYYEREINQYKIFSISLNPVS